MIVWTSIISLMTVPELVWLKILSARKKKSTGREGTKTIVGLK
jgi:hypothetical protein